jgi:hypothetical protein
VGGVTRVAATVELVWVLALLLTQRQVHVHVRMWLLNCLVKA